MQPRNDLLTSAFLATSSKFLWPPRKRSRVKVSCVKAPLDVPFTVGSPSSCMIPRRPWRHRWARCHSFSVIGLAVLVKPCRPGTYRPCRPGTMALPSWYRCNNSVSGKIFPDESVYMPYKPTSWGQWRRSPHQRWFWDLQFGGQWGGHIFSWGRRTILSRWTEPPLTSLQLICLIIWGHRGPEFSKGGRGHLCALEPPLTPTGKNSWGGGGPTDCCLPHTTRSPTAYYVWWKIIL